MDRTKFDEILQSALAIHDPHARAEFLSTACQSDDELLQKLEARIAEEESIAAPATLNTVAKRETLPETPTIVTSDPSHDAFDEFPDRESLLSGMADHSDRYDVLGELGRGGMGAILKGRCNKLGRELAIKVLLKEYVENPRVIRQFLEEAQIGGQLQHPGIAPVYEIGRFTDERPYFSMKLVKGKRLPS
jgi:hypothetical protein